MNNKLRHVNGVRRLAGLPSRHLDGGFALVTSLLVLVVVTALGAGAFFVSSLNLRIAENTRTAAIAQFNAYEGLDVALLAVARHFRTEEGAYPSTEELGTRLPADRFTGDEDTPRYDVTVLPTIGVDGGLVVTAVGFGPRGAQYETGARVVGVLSPVDVPEGIDESFGRGWVTLGDININGLSLFSIPLWASGSIAATSTRIIGGDNVFVWSGVGESCRISTKHSIVECDDGPPPEVPVFNFDERRALIHDQRALACDRIVEANDTLAADLFAGQTICVNADVTLTLTGTARDVYVIGDRTSELVLNAGSEPAGEDGVGLKAAVGTILTGGVNAALLGVNTLFAASGIDWKNSGAAVTSPGVVGTVIGTEGSLLFSGNTKGTLNAVLWANGHVCKSGGGGLDFNGTIQARGEGEVPASQCEPGIYWNGGGGAEVTDIGNDDLEAGGGSDEGVDYTAAGIRVLSWRP